MGMLVVQPVLREGQGAVGLIGAVVQSMSSAAHHVCHSVLELYFFLFSNIGYDLKNWLQVFKGLYKNLGGLISPC
jgi:hypothetical protein